MLALTRERELVGGGALSEWFGVSELTRSRARVRPGTLVLAGGKIGCIELAHVCDIDQVGLLITGESADPAVLDVLRERGCDVRVVP
jgi:hypothetical protein